MKAFLILMGFLTALISMAEGPRITGNGGGGIQQNGVYKTFYSAGVFIHPLPERNIPGMDILTNTLLSTPEANEGLAKVISASLPSAQRKFFRINEKMMSEGLMERLLVEYARVVHYPKEYLTLFAITDIKKKETYLLPSFYQLKSSIEQAAVLFHEAYWILRPDSQYDEVLYAENILQSYLTAKLEGKFSPDFPRLLGELSNAPHLAMKFAYLADTELQTVPSLISQDGLISLKELFPRKSCGDFGDGTGLCRLNTSFLPLVTSMSQKFPRSYFLKEVISFLSDSEYVIEINFPYFYFDRMSKEDNSKFLFNFIEGSNSKYYFQYSYKIRVSSW